MALAKSLYVFMCTSIQLASLSNIGGTRQDISLSSHGGYGNILIAIDEDVPENMDIITNLQTYFTSASRFMLPATHDELYLERLVILVPPSWTPNSSWATPTFESVDRARIIVSEANINWGDAPYTLQPGLCGEESDYIHLTPEYLTDIANRTGVSPGKKLVREFAHLKWGLFDEDVPVTDTISPHIYTQGNNFLGTLCVEYGFFGDYDSDGMQCYLDDNGMVDSSCRFYVNTAEANASIMYNEQFESVVEFCSTDGTIDSTKHNKVAPNRQNRLCQERSAWDVMNNLTDFGGSYNLSRAGATPPDPMFTVIQEPAPTTPSEDNCPQDIVCLSLDVSGSMDNFDRIYKMNVAMRKYIQRYLREDSLLGIVSFSSSANVVSPMTQITNNTVRESLAAAVPSRAGGGTSIGSGLSACIDLLQSYTGTNDSKIIRILLLSDGIQTSGLAVADVQDEIVRLRITVDTIAYSFAADPVLSALSDITGGISYFTSDDNIQKLDTSLIQTVQRHCEKNSLSLLVSERLNLTGNSITRYVPIDNTIGINTTIVFSFTNDINVSVTTEQGNHTIIIEKDLTIKVLTAVILGQANGLIGYNITNVDPTTPENLVITITSYPIPGVRQIRVTTRLSETNISDFSSKTQLRAYVGIFQGLTPVKGVTVEGTIESKMAKKMIIYNDEGTGMDSTPNDGIYSATFFAQEFTGDGYYSFNIDISGEGFTSPGDSNNRRRKRQAPSSLGNVTRTGSAGLVIVDNFVAVPDTTPPERIKDLQLVGATNNNGSDIYTLRWTAPGDDLNIGTVSGYQFSVSNDSSLTNLKPLPADALLTDVSSLLVAAGSSVEIQINAGKINSSSLGLNEAANMTTYYFRILSEDAVTPPNQADWSNLVSASIINPMLFTVATTTTTTATTTTTPTTTTTVVTTTTTTPTITTTTPTTTTTPDTTTTAAPTTTATLTPTATPTTTAVLTTASTATTIMTTNFTTTQEDTGKITFILGASIGLLCLLALGLGLGAVTVFLCNTKHGKSEGLPKYQDFKAGITDRKTAYNQGFYSMYDQPPPQNRHLHRSSPRYPARNYPAYTNRGYYY